MTKNKFEEIYQNSHYQVSLNNTWQTIVINQVCDLGITKSWSMILADNPYSNLLSEEENIQRRIDLQEELVREGFREIYQARAGSHDESWPWEYGLLVPNFSEEDAKKLGVKFEQNAIIVAYENHPKIVWCLED